VSKDDRYLSCFVSTRSEIVVPIKKGTRVIGEIDIDSNKPAAFGKNDAAFLEKIAVCLSEHLS
jgi:GAF domain-containing protein